MTTDSTGRCLNCGRKVESSAGCDCLTHIKWPNQPTPSQPSQETIDLMNHPAHEPLCEWARTYAYGHRDDALLNLTRLVRDLMNGPRHVSGQPSQRALEAANMIFRPGTPYAKVAAEVIDKHFPPNDWEKVAGDLAEALKDGMWHPETLPFTVHGQTKQWVTKGLSALEAYRALSQGNATKPEGRS